MADLSDFYDLDSTLGDDEIMIRDTVSRFVENEFNPIVAEHFEAGTFPNHRRYGFARDALRRLRLRRCLCFCLWYCLPRT